MVQVDSKIRNSHYKSVYSKTLQVQNCRFHFTQIPEIKHSREILGTFLGNTIKNTFQFKK